MMFASSMKLPPACSVVPAATSSNYYELANVLNQQIVIGGTRQTVLAVIGI